MSDKQFADGLRVGRRENAPDFKICELGINVAEFTSFLRAHEKASGWVNIDINRSKNGKYYGELNTWTPEQKATHDEARDLSDVAREVIEGEIDPNEIPF